MEQNVEQQNIFRIITAVKKIIESIWFSFLVVVSLITYQQWLMGEDLFAPDANILLNQAIYYGLIYVAFHLNMRRFFPYIFSNLKGWWWKVPVFVILESLILFALAVAISVGAGKMEIRFAFALLDLTNLYHKKAVLGPWFLYTVLNLGYYFCWQAFQLLANLWVARRVTEDLRYELNTSQIQLNNTRSYQHLWFHLLDMGKELIFTNPQTAVKIINLIQYMLKHHGLQMEKMAWVTIWEEWLFMRLLILIARLKSGDVQVICEIDRSMLNAACMPLSLIVIIENMIRHGELGDKRFPAYVRITRSKKALVMSTENRIKAARIAEHFQIGLPNLEEKLAKYYRGEAEFKAWSDKNTFYTRLKMPIIE
ncbi:LytS family sensor histidine kinase [Olivibacter domesticus]|uniref:Histidine kinase n=1 Tax=Olivibacter domesticus TaxID=407022 RepID=A0A1H7KK93_OLID1|nr:hypothetical protein [Olivibacter domesticus]SEK86357.1 hypothetical protein SAMN05661044_01359 [Olivibacter domesticus]